MSADDRVHRWVQGWAYNETGFFLVDLCLTCGLCIRVSDGCRS